MRRQFDLTTLAFVIGITLMFAVLQLSSMPIKQTVAYSDFQRLAAARQVDDLEMTPTRITGSLRMPAAARRTRRQSATAARRGASRPCG